MNALNNIQTETAVATVAPIDFAAATAAEAKRKIAEDVRELARIEEEIGRLEADSKALKAKFAATGHDVVYAGSTLVTISRTEDGEIFDADAMLTALGMTKEDAIAQGYRKARAGSVTVKASKLGRTNSPTQKIADGKRVFVAE